MNGSEGDERCSDIGSADGLLVWENHPVLPPIYVGARNFPTRTSLRPGFVLRGRLGHAGDKHTFSVLRFISCREI
jgi:hypothetical protein